MKEYVNQIIFRTGDGVSTSWRGEFALNLERIEAMLERNAWNDFKRIVFMCDYSSHYESHLLNFIKLLLLFVAFLLQLSTRFIQFTPFYLVKEDNSCYCCFPKLFSVLLFSFADVLVLRNILGNNCIIYTFSLPFGEDLNVKKEWSTLNCCI